MINNPLESASTEVALEEQENRINREIAEMQVSVQQLTAITGAISAVVAAAISAIVSLLVARKAATAEKSNTG